MIEILTDYDVFETYEVYKVYDLYNIALSHGLRAKAKMGKVYQIINGAFALLSMAQLD